MDEDTSLIIFKVISNFIKDINQNFRKTYSPQSLYMRVLIEKTTISS